MAIFKSQRRTCRRKLQLKFTFAIAIVNASDIAIFIAFRAIAIEWQSDDLTKWECDELFGKSKMKNAQSQIMQFEICG